MINMNMTINVEFFVIYNLGLNVGPKASQTHCRFLFLPKKTSKAGPKKITKDKIYKHKQNWNIP